MITHVPPVHAPVLGRRAAVRGAAEQTTLTLLDLDGPDGPDEAVSAPDRPATVLALVRLHRHPLGLVQVPVAAGCPFGTALRRAAVIELGRAMLEHEFRDRSLGRAPWLHAPHDPVPPCLRRRAELIGDAPPISVIVGTRERPDRLARCLDSLAAVDYPHFEVLVVDEDPETEATRRLVARAPGRVRYLRQRRRGRSAAHGLGAAEATGRLLAFTDDDVEVDRDWLPAIAESFADRRVGCVAGLVMRGDAVSRAQPFTPLVIDDGSWRLASGANLAFDADALDMRHGFSSALRLHHARTREDLSGALRTIAADGRVVYQPDALVWHRPAAVAGVAA